jgi:hypothetical protein
MPVGALSSSTILAEVRQMVRSDLSSLITQIDLDGFYPEEVLRKIGAVGGRQHLASQNSSRHCQLNEKSLTDAFLMRKTDAVQVAKIEVIVKEENQR